MLHLSSGGDKLVASHMLDPTHFVRFREYPSTEVEGLALPVE